MVHALYANIAKVLRKPGFLEQLPEVDQIPSDISLAYAGAAGYNFCLCSCLPHFPVCDTDWEVDGEEHVFIEASIWELDFN